MALCLAFSFNTFANDKDAWKKHCDGMVDISTRHPSDMISTKLPIIKSIVAGMEKEDKDLYYEDLKAYGHETNKIIESLMARIKAITSIAKALRSVSGDVCRVYTHESDIADFILEDETCFNKLQATLDGVYKFKIFPYRMKSSCFGNDQVVFTIIDPEEDENMQVQIDEFEYEEK